MFVCDININIDIDINFTLSIGIMGILVGYYIPSQLLLGISRRIKGWFYIGLDWEGRGGRAGKKEGGWDELCITET